MRRRLGDTIQIDGAYQHRARTSGNPVQRFWHGTKRLVIADLLPPESTDFVLDVGCGSGVVSSFLGETAARVIGVDANEDALSYAQKTFGRETVEFRSGLVDESFALSTPPDKIYCLEVIEHIYFEQGVAMLKAFRSLIRPGGHVLLTTPNYRSAWPVIEWALDNLTSAANMEGHQHVTHYHARTLRQVAELAGLEVEKVVSVSCLAPWLAPLSRRLARRVHDLESRASFVPGSILVAILRKAPG